MMAHTFNPSIGRQGFVNFCKSEAILVYILNSRAANTT